MGQTVFDWAGKHTCGAHGGRAHREKGIDRSGGDLRADGEAVDCHGSGCVSVPLAIVGYGKMGRMVEQMAPGDGFGVRSRLRSADSGKLSAESLGGAKTAIEFTSGAAAAENLGRLAALGVATVCGTTGWFDHLPAARDEFVGANTALVYGPNFSIGVNLFLEVVTHAAK